jgi:hypothetical protein
MRFRFHPNTDNYFCSGCYAFGRLPVVEGQTLCPGCGELIWTVKRAVEQSEFSPDYRLPIRTHLPILRLRWRWFARPCVRFFPSFVRRYLDRREQRVEAAMKTISEQLQGCRRRDEFQNLLGPCRSLLVGKGLGWIRNGTVEDSPDVIGFYEVDTCSVQVWFKDDRIQSFTTSGKPTALGVAMSTAEDSGRANRARPQSGVTFAVPRRPLILVESVVVQTVFLRHGR